MGAKSLEDALTQLDDYDRVSAADADVLLQVRSAKRHTVELAARRSPRGRERSRRRRRRPRGTVSQLEQVRADRAAYITDLAHRRSLDAARISQITRGGDRRRREVAAALPAASDPQRHRSRARNGAVVLTTARAGER